jgi:hypothetical protein
LDLYKVKDLDFKATFQLTINKDHDLYQFVS